MKHALSAPLLLLLLVGCASDHEVSQVNEMHFAVTTRPEPPPTVRQAPVPSVQTAPTDAQPPTEPKAKPRESSEHLQRTDRFVYAQGLEKILVTNGFSVSVLVYEGQVAPTPTLMFIGYFSKDFVQRAVTNGAVLERARALGFKSVDFFDRGPDGHYQFVLSKTAPLPKCATYNRLCL